jgi:hypothetical protein
MAEKIDKPLSNESQDLPRGLSNKERRAAYIKEAKQRARLYLIRDIVQSREADEG